MIQPIIMAGGMGTRLWPLSRAAKPKQFLPLATDRALIADAAALIATHPGMSPPLIFTGQAHGFLAQRALDAAKLAYDAIVLEPVARSTAAVAVLGSLLAARKAKDAIVLLLAADHAIRGQQAFMHALNQAAELARQGMIALFGVPPREASSRFGYIECGKALGDDAHMVASFTEKPSAAVADKFVAGGRHLWNSGNFVFRADTMLEEFARHAPDVLSSCEAALAGAQQNDPFLSLDAAAMEKCRAISLDYAIIEKTNRAAVVRLEAGWSDIGTWSALWEWAEKDDGGNVLQGETVIEDCQGLYIRSSRGIVGGIGLRDLVVIADEDAVLVTPRIRDHEVGALVERLRIKDRTKPGIVRKVERPWGSYEVLQTGEGYQVKLIEVRPGEALSLQYHRKRSEYWVVVRGSARVTVDDSVREYQVGEAVFVPIGAKHRIENLSKRPFAIIEVQLGSYLGEDDIVRLEDRYGRS